MCSKLRILSITKLITNNNDVEDQCNYYNECLFSISFHIITKEF